MGKNFFKVLITATILSNIGYTFPSKSNYSINKHLLSSNYRQSFSLLEISKDLVSTSNQLLKNPSESNIAYINAMLRLSQDIGEMSDRIGEMSNRIVATELQIGAMSDRILETQKKQNTNIALTQANILKTQENFSKILVKFSFKK